MTLQQLHQVITIADSGSMNEAAKKLFISQPSLSATVKELEQESVIQENNRLIELAEKTKQIEVVKEEIVKEKVEEMVSKPVEVEEFDPIKTEKIAITGTLSQRRKLKEFLDLNKMKYERIED